MRALEFKSKIHNNSILIPHKMQYELSPAYNNKNVRVIVFVEDFQTNEDKAYNKVTANQFLKGYAESVSIYDL